MSVKFKEPVHSAAARGHSAAAARDWLLSLWPPAACILLAFLAACTPLFGGMRPLGLCLAASVSPPYALLAAAGAAAGYTFSLHLASAAPYLACVAAVAVLRAVSGPRQWAESPIFPACAGALCYVLVRIGLAFTGPSVFTNVLSACAEGMLLVGMSYLLTGFFALRTLTLRDADPEQKACLCFAFMVLVACLTPYGIFGLAPAHILGACAVLCAAWTGGASGAAVTGIAVLTALCAADPSSLYAGAGIAAGGLAAGLFASQSRPLAASVFCGAGFLGVLCAPDSGPGLLLMTELVLASAAFLTIPSRLLARTNTPTAFAQTPAGHAAATALASRLETLSDALAGAGDTVRSVCLKAPRRAQGEPALADAVSQRCCTACARRFACWVDHANDCYAAFAQMERVLAEGGWISAESLPLEIGRMCSQPQALAAAINTEHARRSAGRGAKTQDALTRAALCEQYGALASSLGELAGEFSLSELPDRRKSRRLLELLKDLGLEPMDASVASDAHGRLVATACLPPIRFSEDELEALGQEATALCGRRFSAPEAVSTPALTMLTFRQAPCYRAEFGVFGLPAAEGGVSADAARAFTCEGGYACAVLCDGMGTGRAAAVDGVMAVQLASDLLKAGFAPKETARLVNVSLALKNGGGDETATTLDILKVDLYTGRAQLFKAGAAPSFVLRSSAVDTYQAESVPLGILDKVLGKKLSLTLHEGDTAVLASDGAMSAGAPAFSAILMEKRRGSAQTIASHAVKTAKSRAAAPDDVTVLTVRLHRSGQ